MSLKLITSMASRELLKELCARHERQSHQTILVEAAGGVDVAQRLRGGEVVDVAVLSRNAIDDLVRDKVLLANTVTDIAHSGIAVALSAHAEAIDISTEEALRLALLRAPAIGYSTGPSGVYLEKQFAAWGMLEQIRSRIVVAPPGVSVGSLLASGQVALGFQQLSELIHVAGIRVLGPLPEAIQLLTTFSGALTSAPLPADGALGLLQYLASPQVADVKAHFGMQPC